MFLNQCLPSFFILAWALVGSFPEGLVGILQFYLTKNIARQIIDMWDRFEKLPVLLKIVTHKLVVFPFREDFDAFTHGCDDIYLLYMFEKVVVGHFLLVRIANHLKLGSQ